VPVAQGLAYRRFNPKFDCYPGIEQFTVEIDNYPWWMVNIRTLICHLHHRCFLWAPISARCLFVSQQSERNVRTEIELPPGFRQSTSRP
jgi:hypothetical protein